MLLSFSVPEMLPYIRSGILAAQDRPEPGRRVKRQTIRRRGPRAEKLLSHAKESAWTHPYDLHLWWKSRTSEREHLGTILGGGRVYPINILHSTVTPPDARPYPILRIDGPTGWRKGDPMIFWSEQTPPGGPFDFEVREDGFDSVEAFRDYFVPNVGDRFEAIFFRW